MRRIPALAVALIVLFGAALARAQDGSLDPRTTTETPAAQASCAGGRVATDVTHGRCCWPGQSFSIDRGRCEGPPMCPAGSVAHGDACVEGAPTGITAQHDVVAPATLERAGRETETVSSIRHGLVGAGVSFLLAGYVGAATYGPIWTGQLPWLIPLVGPLTELAIIGFGYWYDWAMAGVTTAFQVAGFVMLIIGVVDRRPVTLERGPGGTRRVALELGPLPTLRF